MTRRTVRRLLVDTDVVSFFFKDDTRRLFYRPHLQGQRLTISFMTLAELDYWGRVRNWGDQRRTALNAYLARFVVAHSSADLCRWWSVVYAEARRKGKPIQPSDAWIAATALLYDMPLVTHNPADFSGVEGLTVISEVPR